MKRSDKEQEELLYIVARLTELYTSRESTSIPYEKARMLMEAALYCINEVENEASTSISLTEGERDLNVMYQHGYDLVVEKTKKTVWLYNQMLPYFQSYGNHCYYETVVKGLPQFFLHYDARFCPQNHLLTLDYPVLMHLEKLSGIDRIEQYLYCIMMEQRFLSGLSEVAVNRVFEGYDYEFQEAIINVCSPIVRYRIAGGLLGQLDGALALEQESISRLNMLVQHTDSGELLSKCREVLHNMIRNEYGDHKDLYGYLSCDLQDFVVELTNACKYDRLRVLFPV